MLSKLSEWKLLISSCETLNASHRALSGALLGLTVQLCGEPCGSAAGFDFLTLKFFNLFFKTRFRQCLNVLVVGSTFYTLKVWVLKPVLCCKPQIN
jgi:hypothetical protein